MMDGQRPRFDKVEIDAVQHIEQAIDERRFEFAAPTAVRSMDHHDGRCILVARELGDGGDAIAALDDVHDRSQIFRETDGGSETLARGGIAWLDHREREELGAMTGGESPRAANRMLAGHVRIEQDEDALGSAPDRIDLVVTHVAFELIVDRGGGMAQGELAQGGQVAFPEEAP